MAKLSHLNKRTVASLALAVGISLPVAGLAQVEGERIDRLLGQLAEADPGSDDRLLREIFTEWSRSGSPTVDLLLSRGEDAIEAGEFDLAIDHLSAAIDYAPDFAEAYHLRATAHFLSGRYGPSLEDLGRTLALNPRHFRAMRGFAVILEELGQTAQAVEVLVSVTDLHPADQEAQATLERLRREMNGQAL